MENHTEKRYVQGVLHSYGIAWNSSALGRVVTQTPECYSVLFEYYAFFLRVMPYGTMKAHSGDPYEWIESRVNALQEKR